LGQIYLKSLFGNSPIANYKTGARELFGNKGYMQIWNGSQWVEGSGITINGDTYFRSVNSPQFYCLLRPNSGNIQAFDIKWV